MKWEAMPDDTYIKWKTTLFNHLINAVLKKMPPKPVPPTKSITETEGQFLARKARF